MESNSVKIQIIDSAKQIIWNPRPTPGGMQFQKQDQPSYLLRNPRWEKSELEIYVDLAERFQPLPGHIWIASSGSSTLPGDSLKLVALAQEAVLASARAVTSFLEAKKNEPWLCCLPEFHVGGLGIFARAFVTDSTVFQLGPWTVDGFLNSIRKNRIVWTTLVPAQVYDLVVQNVKCPPSLKSIVVGGGHLSDDLFIGAARLGWPVLKSFGMTEAASQIATQKPWALGREYSGTETPVEVLRSFAQAPLQILPHMQCEQRQGFLHFRSPSMLTGYAQRKEGKSIWVEPTEGWWPTDDLVEIRAGKTGAGEFINEKYLYPNGRATNVIKVLGESLNLELLEQKLRGFLEQELRGYLAQREVESPTLSKRNLSPALVVIPLLDERRGFALHLVFEGLESGGLPTLDKINSVLTGIEKISSISYLVDFPRTALGKVLRGEVQSLLLHK